jgi:hypothetical protein
LYHHVKNELEERDLEEVAKYYVQHGYLGYVIERNGIAWNDNLAGKLSEQYQEIAIESLRSLILLPRMLRILQLKDQEIMEVQSTLDLDVLKSYFNPESSYPYGNEKKYFDDRDKDPKVYEAEEKAVYKTTSINFCKLLRTTRFKLALMFYELHEFAETLEVL